MKLKVEYEGEVKIGIFERVLKTHKGIWRTEDQRRNQDHPGQRSVKIN